MHDHVGNLAVLAYIVLSLYHAVREPAEHRRNCIVVRQLLSSKCSAVVMVWLTLFEFLLATQTKIAGRTASPGPSAALLADMGSFIAVITRFNLY